MSRRFAPHIFAGLLGVATGIYIFKPVLDQVAVANKEGISNEDTAKSAAGGTPRPPSAGTTTVSSF